MAKLSTVDFYFQKLLESSGKLEEARTSGLVPVPVLSILTIFQGAKSDSELLRSAGL